MTPFRLLDLFSGMGGFSLGLERSGAFKTVAFCEIDPFCRKVLAKHWPEVPQYDDIRELTAERLAADGIAVDAICGGFPCQDISVAGKGAGLAGERSGLWREYARLIGEIRPRYVIVENVAALLGRGLGDVLADLAALGLDAEWHCVPAAAVGGAQRRDRAWLVATPSRSSRAPLLHSDALHAPCHWPGLHGGDVVASHFDNESGGPRPMPVLADEFWPEIPDGERSGTGDRIAGRLDRYRACGNAVVPQIPELIGRAIAQAEGMTA